MKARGFEDAFIVTYKNGERINISTAISTEKKNKKIQPEKKVVNTSEKKDDYNIQFIVQIGVFKNINLENKNKIELMEGVEKVLVKGNLYKYIAGKYSSLSEAEFRKSEVSQNGFKDAFIYAEKDGERINVKEALRLLNK